MTTPNTTFYPYAPIVAGSSLLIYTGEPVTVEPNADGTVTQPVNTTPYAPVTAGTINNSDGTTGLVQITSYWEGYGWSTNVDMRTIPASQLQQVALSAYASNFADTVQKLDTWYSAAEKQSWPQQIAEANTIAALASGAAIPASVTLIPALAQARGITPQDYATIVLNNAAAYATSYNAALATYQQDRRLAQAATKLSDLPGADHPLLVGMNATQIAAAAASYTAPTA